MRNTQSESLNAELNYTNSVYEYLIAIFDLERAIGDFTIFSTPEEIVKDMERLNKFMENN